MQSDKRLSREVLTMETESNSKMSFKPKGGWFIKREVLVLIALIYVCSVISIGLLVYYLTPCEGTSNTGETEPSEEKVEQRLTDVRLPRHVRPISYDIRLKPLFDRDFNIDGRVTIDIKCYEPGNNITLHIHNMTVHEVTVKDTQERKIGGDDIDTDPKRQFLIIKLDRDMAAEEMYKVKIKFTAVLNNELAGFYRSSYSKNNQQVIIATTQFQPTDARRAFPCFDEPEFKAKFKVSLGRMKNMTSLSNMPINETVDEGDWRWDHYQETHNVSTYLLAFVISDFEKQDYGDGKNWNFSIYGRSKAITNGETTYAGDVAPRIMAFYEQFYKIKYPLPKCDMIAIPDFSAGAMENWGLVTYRETTLLYNSKVSAASDKKRVALVVSHELAHQWFGNLVTPAWWEDLWLNEGFASYVEYLGVDHVQPTWRMMEQLVVNDMQNVMGVDSLHSSHKISVPVSNPDEINEIFDSISYSKGAAIIRMMNNFLTNETFGQGLTEYLEAFSYANANQDDLWHYLTLQAHEDDTLANDVTVKQIMDTWTLQMGYPVVTVTRSGTSATVSQKRFLLTDQPMKSTDEDSSDYSWWIPITFTNKNEKDFSYANTKPSYWIRKGQSSINISNVAPSEKDWVIFNIQEVGYFRVNYDENNWKLLIKQLQDNHNEILPIQRSQILDDALNLARAHQLDYKIALDLTTYLSSETDYFPLISVFNDLEYLDAMLTTTSAYGEFKKFTRGILDKLFNKNDIETLKNADTSYPDLSNTFKQILIIRKACEYGNEECINLTGQMFKEFMEKYDADNADDPNHQIIPDLKGVVYCTAIENGKKKEWDFLWKHYSLATVPSEKATVLKALACTKEVWLLSKYLDDILNETSGIRKQDGVTVFSSVAHNPIGRYLAWDFLRDRWNDIKTYYGAGFSGIARMVRAVSGSFNTKFNLQQLKNFQEDKQSDLRSATRATKQAIEKVQANIKWMENSYEPIVQWLKTQNS